MPWGNDPIIPPPGAQAQPGGWGRDPVVQPPPHGKPASSVGDYIDQELQSGIVEPWSRLKEAVVDQFQNGMSPQEMLAWNRAHPVQSLIPLSDPQSQKEIRTLGALGGVALSPLNAALHAAVIRPAATAMSLIPGTNEATNEQIVGTGLMGLGPGKGGAVGAGARAAEAAQGGRAAEVLAPGVPGSASVVATAPETAAGIVGDAGRFSPTPELEAAPEVSTAPAVRTPTKAQQAKVAAVIRRAVARDAAAGVTPETIAANMDRGVPPMVAGGNNLSGIAEVAANTPGAAQTHVLQAVGERVTGAPQRIMDAVEQHLGVSPEAARGDIEALVDAGRTKAKPLFDQALASPEVVTSPALEALTKTPAGRRAMRAAYEDLLNTPGANPEESGFTVATRPMPGGGNIDYQVEVSGPRAETWDLIRKYLNAQVERDPFKNKPLPDSVAPGNYRVNQLSGILSGELRRLVPGYAEALDTSGDYLSINNAFDRASGKLFTGKLPDFERLWGSLKTPSEQNAARSALASEIMDKFNAGRLTPGVFKSPGVREKLRLAFGDKADGFIAEMEQHAAEMNALRNINGSSRTDVRGEARRDLERQPLHPLDALETGINAATMNIPALGGQALKLGLRALPRADRSVIGDPVMNELLGRAMRDPAVMREMLIDQQRAKLRPPTTPGPTRPKKLSPQTRRLAGSAVGIGAASRPSKSR